MKKTSRKFSRKSPKEALLTGLAQSLILKERVKTTHIRGKEAARLAEYFITKGKKQNLASQRELRRSLSDLAVKKIINELALRYQSRDGGYTRVIKLGQRSSDGAPVAFIELVK